MHRHLHLIRAEARPAEPRPPAKVVQLDVRRATRQERPRPEPQTPRPAA
jgi:hypothetical protein